MEKYPIINKLETLASEMGTYQYLKRRSVFEHINLEEKTSEHMEHMRVSALRNVGVLRPLITEITGTEKVYILQDNVSKYDFDMWHSALSPNFDKICDHAINQCLDMINITIGAVTDGINNGNRDPNTGDRVPPEKTKKLEIDGSNMITLFDAMQLHQKVVEASRDLFKNEHYAQAIFEAFKAVENFVQDKADSTLYGTNLMETVFNEENPIIKVPEAGHYYKDVQRGFKHLFIGATQAIRNPKAHKEIIQKDPYITLEYLGLASFLLKRIDYWEAGIS